MRRTTIINAKQVKRISYQEATSSFINHCKLRNLRPNKYAICWKDNTVPATAKSGSVKLSIWLEGNYTEGCENLGTKDAGYHKPNATVSVKVNVK